MKQEQLGETQDIYCYVLDLYEHFSMLRLEDFLNVLSFLFPNFFICARFLLCIIP